MRILMIISISAVFLLMVLGGLVSATESGMGCGSDWPLCQGRLIPPFEGPEILLEWLHRLVAAATGLLVLSVVGVSWRRNAALARAALGLLALQVALGALAVRLELPSAVSTLHLAAGTGLFAMLIGLWTLAGRNGPMEAHVDLPRSLLWAAVLFTFVQMVLGAYVRHSGAGLACPHPVICLPSEHLSVTMQFLHRLTALVVLCLVHAAGFRVIRLSPERALRRTALSAVVLVVLQVLLGVLSVTTLLQPHVTTTHLAVALLLLGVLVHLAVRAGLRVRVAEEARS